MQEFDIIDKRFLQRGYHTRVLNRAKNIAKSKSRQQYLDKKLVFSTPYSSDFNNIVQTMKTYLPLLHQDPTLDHILKPGVRFVAKKGRSLAGSLSPTMPNTSHPENWLSTKGSYKCAGPRCSLCPMLKKSKFAVSYTTGQTFPMKSFINCNTTHLVYLINCEICHLQYIGCTLRKLKTRIYEHVYSVRSQNTLQRNMSGAAKHFFSVHNGDLSSCTVTGVEKVYKPKS